jgi:Icc-related predicted phosphoesterase
MEGVASRSAVDVGLHLEELMRMATIRVAALGDLHCTKASQGAFQPVFAHIRDQADLVLLAGDLTDYGLPEEAQVLARELAAVRLPIVAVLGNHDRESGREGEVARVLTEAGVTILDGDAAEVLGIGVAGVTGFCGGFGKHALAPWGEAAVKQFVHAAIDEALKLEKALARLRTPNLIALLHYAPVSSTVEGEPPEIYPFLGCSRLEEPINRYPVSLVFHGHAHKGQIEGTTSKGIPVYNVSMPLLTRRFPDRFPFRIFDLTVTEAPHRDITAEQVAVPVPPAEAAEVSSGSVRALK